MNIGVSRGDGCAIGRDDGGCRALAEAALIPNHAVGEFKMLNARAVTFEIVFYGEIAAIGESQNKIVGREGIANELEILRCDA